MDSSWHVLIDVLILLSAALLLGTAFETIRQSAILGYLLAGTLVGPNGLGFVHGGENVHTIAELGVALLLFTIGLEFSFRRLLTLGPIAVVGGTLQVGVTMVAGTAVAAACGLGPRAAVAIGAMMALSSTACVLRLLTDRAAVESLYGRQVLGILLLQDVAVIPLVLLVALLGSGGTPVEAALALLRTVLFGALLIGAFIVLFKLVVPRLFHIERWVRNRELPVLLAIIIAIGSAAAAHQLSISPAMGAFVAGVLMAESPFAVQVRADVSPLRTVLVTLFFASVGMFGEPMWVVEHLHLVIAAVAAIVVGKAVIVWGIVRVLRSTHALAAATGLCLAQVGEFSFVLAEMARETLIGEEAFRLVVSATIISLFFTPFLVSAAPRVATWVAMRTGRPRSFSPGSGPADSAATAGAASEGGHGEETAPLPTDIVVIGFGPAGQMAAQGLMGEHADRIVVIELNPRNAAVAQRYGLATVLGDASKPEVLEHAHVQHASVVIITIPDPATSRAAILHCRTLAPGAALVVRARYHVVRWELQAAGAHDVIDEEEHIGFRLAAEARRYVRKERREE